MMDSLGFSVVLASFAETVAVGGGAGSGAYKSRRKWFVFIVLSEKDALLRRRAGRLSWRCERLSVSSVPSTCAASKSPKVGYFRA